MSLSVQSYMINKNTNYALAQKMTFKAKYISSKAFDAEPEIIEKIKTLPNNVFEELAEFVKFCKSIEMTPKINGVLMKKLAEVRQAKACSNGATKSFIGSSNRIIEGCKWLLNKGKPLSKDDIAVVTKISFDKALTNDIRNSADELLKRNSQIKISLK